MRVASVSTETWLLGGLVALGAVLRFATLGAQSYWFDEAQAAHELHLSLGSMLHSFNAVETAPPLYFLLGWVWVHVFGDGAAALRSLSALAGTALIPITFLTGRELVSRRAGLLAAAFVAVNPFMVWYSQEAREYMLLAILCGASLLFFARTRHDASRRNVTCWAVFSGLALLTHYFAGFLIAPEAAWLLYVTRKRATAVAVAGLLIIELSLTPLLVAHAKPSLLGFIGVTHLDTRIQDIPVAFGLGPTFESSLLSYGLIGAAILVAILIVLLIVGAESDELRGAGICAALAACVLVLPIVAALLGKDYYLERAVIPAWMPLAILVAAACTTRLRAPGAVLATVLIAGFAYGLVKIDTDAQYQRPDWRAVAHSLGPISGRRAIVVYEGGLATDPLRLYLRGVPWTRPTGVLSVGEVDVVGYGWQTVGDPLPSGVKLVSSRRVNDYLVERFALANEKRLTPAEIEARAPVLLGPWAQGSSLLVQSARTAG
ncbi:MAG: glycosyltransferase family 39 protein [Solirubrobacterales bacterium]|nr:glycosyltransferase family 39 protein [Solirubrobacterales bacterium]